VAFEQPALMRLREMLAVSLDKQWPAVVRLINFGAASQARVVRLALTRMLVRLGGIGGGSAPRLVVEVRRGAQAQALPALLDVAAAMHVEQPCTLRLAPAALSCIMRKQLMEQFRLAYETAARARQALPSKLEELRHMALQDHQLRPRLDTEVNAVIEAVRATAQVCGACVRVLRPLVAASACAATYMGMHDQHGPVCWALWCHQPLTGLPTPPTPPLARSWRLSSRCPRTRRSRLRSWSLGVPCS
jgi:hypothetical protein